MYGVPGSSCKEADIFSIALSDLDAAVRERLQQAFARNLRSMRALRGVVYRLLEMQAMAEQRPPNKNGEWLQ